MPLKCGTVDENAIFIGEWEEIVIIRGAVEYYVGSVPGGQLEIGHEFYDHWSTCYPRKKDIRIPVNTHMKFTGNLEELHNDNIKLLLGQDPSTCEHYIYIGALRTIDYVSVRGRRRRQSDAFPLEFYIYKTNATSLLQIGSSAEAISTPIEFEALDDSDGDYGGSCDAPLGYLYVPCRTPGEPTVCP